VEKTALITFAGKTFGQIKELQPFDLTESFPCKGD
jgi:hypothetical protein